MIKKRFEVHSMIQGMDIGATMDLDTLQELIAEFGSSAKIELFITDNDKNMTYREVCDLLNNFLKENEQLKSDLDYFKAKNGSLETGMFNLERENEQLKSEIEKLSYSNEDLLEEKRVWKQMSDEYVKLYDENEQLKQRLQKIQNSFEVNWTQNYVEFDKDKLYIKDNNTEIRLDGTNLFIKVYIPQINEYYRFKYRVTGRSLMTEFIENYNSNGDVE